MGQRHSLRKVLKHVEYFSGHFAVSVIILLTFTSEILVILPISLPRPGAVRKHLTVVDQRNYLCKLLFLKFNRPTVLLLAFFLDHFWNSPVLKGDKTYVAKSPVWSVFRLLQILSPYPLDVFSLYL